MNRTTLITLGLSLAACMSGPPSDPTSSPPSSSPTSPPTSPATPADYEDTAQTIASSTATGGAGGVGFGDVLVFQDAMSIARGHLPLGFLRDADGHIRGDLMGVSHDFTVTCKDAAGNVQTACDSMTDSATVTIKETGDLQTPIFSMSIDREGNFTITGLQSATATFNGDSSFSLDTSLMSIFHQGVTASFMFDATASYKAITIATADHTITGGSASFEVKGHRTVTGAGGGSGTGSGSGSGAGSGGGSGSGGGHDVDESFDVTAVLTFNADQTATLVLDGTQTFTIDLKTGQITKD